MLSGVEMQRRVHTTRGELFAYQAGSGRREIWVSRWALPRAPGPARNVRAAAALAGRLWRVMWRADRAGGGAHGARRDPSPQTTDMGVQRGGESVSADRGVTAGRSQGSFTTVRLAATLGDRSPKDARHDPELERRDAWRFAEAARAQTWRLESSQVGGGGVAGGVDPLSSADR